uniref:Uncharacterized protein n=1 Tax=Avena sativa TaxID=4498 RepID=A0ACD5YN32_AVESA
MVVTAASVQDQGLRAGVGVMAVEVEGSKAEEAVYTRRRKKKAQTGERVASKEPCAGTVCPAEVGGERWAVSKERGGRAGTFSAAGAEEAAHKLGGAGRAAKKKRNAAVNKKKGECAGTSSAAGELRMAVRRKMAARRPEARTEFVGVSRRQNGKYGAQISRSKGFVRWLGTFDTAEEAARAFDAAAVELDGASAVTNFTQGGESSGQLTGRARMKVKKLAAARPDARTEFRGVTMQKKGKYNAQIWDLESKHALPLGTFGTAVEAARAYDAAALELPGASAVTNFRASGGTVRMKAKKPPPPAASSDAWNEFRGVRRRPSGKYSARIWDSKAKSARWLGCFDTAEEAVRAYDAAAVKQQGAAPAATTNLEQQQPMDLLDDFPVLPAPVFSESLIPGPQMNDLWTDLPPAE